MNTQLDINTNRDNHWLNIAETIAVVGSVGGSIASIFVKEIALASIPLSTCVALNLINRKRLLNLVETKNDRAVATLSEHNQNDHGNICDRIMQIEESVTKLQNKYETDNQNVSGQLQQISSDFQKNIKTLNSQYTELASKTVKIAQSTTSSSAELYLQNASGYQQMGETEKAIAEYTKAIELDEAYAEAYVARGLLSANLGKKQLAVKDLRTAAKLYFDREDLANYQRIKQKTQEIHQVKANSTSEPQDAEAVLANSLFS